MDKKRLFVNLRTEHFMDFKSGQKKYELRRYGGSFTKDWLVQGREVELRNAYSRGSLFGKVGNVVQGSLQEVFDNVGFKQILPRAPSREEAVRLVNELIPSENYIAFEVILSG